MSKPAPRDVWMVDLGMTAKVRPCLVLSDYPADNELALVVVVPHTTAVRGNRWEHVCTKQFLQPVLSTCSKFNPSRFRASNESWVSCRMWNFKRCRQSL